MSIDSRRMSIHLRRAVLGVSFLSGFIPSAAAHAACDVQFSFEKATAFIETRQFKEATAMLAELKDCTGLSPVERFNLGWLYGRARNFKDALVVFKTVSADVPDQLTHRYAVALSNFELGNYAATVNVLTKPNPPAALDAKCANLLGVAYSKLEMYDKASAIFSQTIHDRPDDISAYLNLVTLCADGGNLVKASGVAADAVRAFPDSSQAAIVFGAASTLLGELDKAFVSFSKAVRLAPSDANAIFFLALTEFKLDKFDDAISVVRGAGTAGIEDSDLNYLLAECLLRIGPDQTQTAMAALNKAIELNKNSIAARTLRGRLLLDAGKPQDALVDLALAERLDPTSRSATYSLARAYRAVGRPNEAKELFKKVAQQSEGTLKELSDRRLSDVLKDSDGRK